MKTSDLFHLALMQPNGDAVSSLAHLVVHVVLRRTEEEMSGVHAAWCVALVENPLLRRNRTMHHLPSVAMSSGLLAAAVDEGVALLRALAEPQMASRVGLGNPEVIPWSLQAPSHRSPQVSDDVRLPRYERVAHIAVVKW